MPVFGLDGSLGSISWVPVALEPPSKNILDYGIQEEIVCSACVNVRNSVYGKVFGKHGGLDYDYESKVKLMQWKRTV